MLVEEAVRALPFKETPSLNSSSICKPMHQFFGGFLTNFDRSDGVIEGEMVAQVELLSPSSPLLHPKSH